MFAVRPALLLAVLGIAWGNASAQQPGKKAAGHVHHATPAPIGVMGSHLHPEGGWMVSYRFMRMEMEGLRDGSEDVTTQEAFASYGYFVAPTKMTMDMHMLGLMYGLTNDLTLVLMAPFLSSEMNHVVNQGGPPPPPGIAPFSTSTSGIGDVKLGGLYRLAGGADSQLLLNATVSAPTGSIDEEDFTPLPPPARTRVLPYPMQLGSGTWDLHPGLTWTSAADGWGHGLQFVQTLRIGESDEDYRLGNRSVLSGWLAHDVAHVLGGALSGSARHTASRQGDVHGRDARLANALPTPTGYGVPTAIPELRGGKRADLGFGLSFIGHEGLFLGHELGLELALPVWQNLDGPQLETDWVVSIGWTLRR